MSINEYFDNAIVRVKTEVDKESDEYLLSVDAVEVAEYYAQKYGLPLIEKDETRKINIKKGRSHYGHVPLEVLYPVVQKQNLETVIRSRSSTFFTEGFSLQLQGSWLVTYTEMHDENLLKVTIENLEKVIGWKNKDVCIGNERIRESVKAYVEDKQTTMNRENEMLRSIIEKASIPLEVKKDEVTPVVDFRVKEELKPLIRPSPKKAKELVLESAKVATLIEYIRNSCLSFEKTPTAFAKLEEEDLRNVILGNLNAIFKGDATGETFSKLGKTDIYLRIPEGNILIAECKYWDGKEKYIEGIDQLFRYLTWRENYGVLVTFVTRRGFTDVIRKAREAANEHRTFLIIQANEHDCSEFKTSHRFPEDAEKKVEIYHLLFNLFVE